MYYKSYMPSIEAWGVFKKMPGQRDPDCIVSNIEEIDCDRLLRELSVGIEAPEFGQSKYRLTMFKTGWSIFLDSQELPGGTLMLKSGLLSNEMFTLLKALKNGHLPDGWEL